MKTGPKGEYGLEARRGKRKSHSLPPQTKSEGRRIEAGLVN